MEIENGRKKAIKVPNIIKSSPELIQHFIAGFFDAEGSVCLKKNERTCQIALSQSQRSILEEIQEELSFFGIETKMYEAKSNHWILYGNKDSILPFFEKIPIIHQKKKLKLEKAIKNGQLDKVHQPLLA